MKRLHLAVVLALSITVALASCQVSPTETAPPSPSEEPTVQPPTSIPTEAPTETAALTPTAEPTATTEPSPTPDHPAFVFHKTAGNSILTGGRGLDFKGQYTDPGAVVFHDGLFHMYYNNLHGYPPKSVGIGYATSEDGYTWTRISEESILNIEDLPFEAQSYNVTDVIVTRDGTWLLYIQTRDEYGGKVPGRIGAASAPSPQGPWTFHPEPVLSPDPGSWDAFSIHRSCVVETEDGFIMYYVGYGDGFTHPYIGMATSPDGFEFTKYNNPDTTDELFALSDPVLRPEALFFKESTQLRYPNVFQTEDGWLMFYRTSEGSTSSKSEIHAVISEDGIHWKKVNYEPLLTSKDIGSFGIIWVATIEKVEDTYYLYMELAKGSDTYINLATFSGDLTK